MILVGGWWGAGAGPGRLVRARRCGGAGRGAAAHRLTHWLWIFTVVSRAADRGSTPLQPRHTRTRQLAVSPCPAGCRDQLQLDNSITLPPHPGQAAPVADSSAVLPLAPVRRGWSLVATVDTMVRCVGGSDASSRPAPGACRWMVPCPSTLQHPPR